MKYTHRNVSWNWGLEKIKKYDQILVCRNGDADLVLATRHDKGVYHLSVQEISYFGGYFTIRLETDDEIVARRDELVSFYDESNKS